jgi:hypothetical protein
MASAETRGSSKAADFAFELLTRNGHRSWMEMIAHNATMAIEHWYGTELHSHSWCVQYQRQCQHLQKESGGCGSCILSALTASTAIVLQPIST